jgi:hypothetical protein
LVGSQLSNVATMIVFLPQIKLLVSHQAFVKEKLEEVSQEFASMEQLMMAMQLEVGSQEFASMESLMDIQLNLCPNPLAIIVESGRHEDKKDKGHEGSIPGHILFLNDFDGERERENTCWVCIPVHVVLLTDVFD